MEQAFKIIDLDDDNYITKDELEAVMGDLNEDVFINNNDFIDMATNT